MRQNVRGNALIYSLFVVLVISSVLVLLFMLTQYSAGSIIGLQQNIQQQKNNTSAIALLCVDQPSQTINTTQTTTLFSAIPSTVTTKRQQWGAYELIGSYNHQNRSSKYGILGYVPSTPTSLYLANTNQALKLAGNTQLAGTCYLPEKGVERANITGNPYRGAQLIYGNKQVSNKTLPPLKKDFIQQLEQPATALDSVVLWNEQLDSMQHSFQHPKLHYISSNPILLSHQKITGNVIIESNQAITVASTAHLGNIQLKAPYIYIESNYQGALQIQARDSIVLDDNVTLNYPSSIVLYDSKSVKDPASFIRTGNQNTIYGGIVAYQKNYNYRDKTSIQLAPKTTVTGTIYVNGVIALKDVTLNGTAYCQQFLLQNRGSTYTNTLLDVAISHKNRPASYLGGNLLELNKQAKKGIINWVE